MTPEERASNFLAAFPEVCIKGTLFEAKMALAHEIREAEKATVGCHADLVAALEFYIGGEPGPEYVEYRSPSAVRKML